MENYGESQAYSNLIHDAVTHPRKYIVTAFRMMRQLLACSRTIERLRVLAEGL